MLNLARFSIQRPVAAGIISVALLVLGLFRGWQLPVSLYPEISFPFVEVRVPFPGASPEQVEARILKPLEAELAGLRDLKRVFGFARGNGGSLILEFKLSANRDQAAAGVRERVSLARGQFPQGAKEPTVRSVDVGAVPILIYGVESSLPVEEVKRELDKTLIRSLQRTDGVNEAALIGIGDEQLELSLDAEKLSQLRVPALEVFQHLTSYLTVIPWGEVQSDGKDVATGRPNLPSDPTYWAEQALHLHDGRDVRLGDLGLLKIIRDEEDPNVLINGKRGLGLVVSKRADANTVETVKRVERVIKSFQDSQTSSSPSTHLFSILNQATFIQENAHEVWIALVFGGAFAVFVILFFLTDLKSAIISATALPVSVAGSFIFMKMFGFSLNMMSLLALSLAIGLLIDDAVVVRESIFQELEHGKSPKEAAVSGTDKVFSAVLATSLAVIAVFLPVGLMDGMVGQFFKEFGLTICIAVTISTWVAFTLDPMLSAYFGGVPKPFQGQFWAKWRAFLESFDHRIGVIGKFSFRNPTLVVGLSIMLLVGSIVLSLSRGADFLAFEDRGQFVVNLKAPAGTSKADLEVMTQQVVEKLKNLEGLKNTYAQMGTNTDKNNAEIRFVFNTKNERAKGLLEIQRQARELLKPLDFETLIMDPPPIEGVGSEAPISIYVYGEHLENLLNLGKDLLTQVKAIPGIAEARLESSPFSKNYSILVNKDDLALSGASTQQVEMTGRLALAGIEAGQVGEDNLPFRVRLETPDRTLPKVMQTMLVPTMRGPQPIETFAKAQEGLKASSIEREKRSRKIVIWATLDRTKTYGIVLESLQSLIDSIPKPYFAEMGGDKEVFEEMVSSFAIAILGSFFFIFVILSIQFENLLRPFIILLSLPLAIIGGLFALFVFGLQLALGALIGMILLIGLAAKNGILLVDAIDASYGMIPRQIQTCLS